jgi:16S rRNA (uracil1498-N3)-methyltransferase
MARFFISSENVHDGRAMLTGQESNHLRRVLRLRPNDRIIVFDDSGWEHEAVIRSFEAETSNLEIVRSYQVDKESPLRVTLALALTKGDRIDFTIEKATELGVHTIVPFACSRTVPKLDKEKIEKRTLRWQKIAVGAAKQCGRTRVPDILPLTDLHALVAALWPDTLRLIFWEEETNHGLAELKKNEPNVDSIVLLIGPEGGFSRDEANQAINHGFKPIRLGGRILRAETAAVSAVAAVQLLWGDLQ